MALRILRWTGAVVAVLLLLVVAALLVVNTSPGRRFVVDRLAGYTTASGLNFRASRIDGSLYGKMVLHDVTVRDTRGTFATIPRLTVDWRPFAYLRSKIDVRTLSAPTATLMRRPELKAVRSDPNAPILPDLDISLRRLAVGRLTILPPVTGHRHTVTLEGSAEIADRRAQIKLDARAVRGPMLAGGDRLHLVLDAAPQKNRLAVDADLFAPAGGVVDSYAKLGKALTLKVQGRGDWAQWRGRADGTLGGAPVTALEITGTSGTFEIKGTVKPSPLLAGAATRLTAPEVRLHGLVQLDERRAKTRLEASSESLTLNVSGLIDLGRSRFGGLRIDARLLRASDLAPALTGRDVGLSATLDGPFAAPRTTYRATAGALGIGEIRILGLAVKGSGTIDTNRLRIPVHATARAITGLDQAAGGALADIRLDGDIAYQNGKLAADNLRLRSDRIDATAIILADLATGTYTGALKGRVNDYEVNGLGRVNLVTDAKLVPGAAGGFAIKGHVKILTRRLDNASIRQQLGGDALITADVAYDLARGATVSNLRLRAPGLQISGGEGFYRTDGRIGFHADGSSAAYGPVSVEVAGTVARPQLHLRAEHPGLGLGLSGLEAAVEERASAIGSAPAANPATARSQSMPSWPVQPVLPRSTSDRRRSRAFA